MPQTALDSEVSSHGAAQGRRGAAVVVFPIGSNLGEGVRARARASCVSMVTAVARSCLLGASSGSGAFGPSRANWCLRWG